MGGGDAAVQPLDRWRYRARFTSHSSRCACAGIRPANRYCDTLRRSNRENLPVTDYRKLFDLTGKNAVVLGAASGIGKSSAEALAALGARVFCADLAADAAEATASGIREQGGWAEPATCDAADVADVAALAKTVMQKFPWLDIAVTTPGLNIRKCILDYTEE